MPVVLGICAGLAGCGNSGTSTTGNPAPSGTHPAPDASAATTSRDTAATPGTPTTAHPAPGSQPSIRKVAAPSSDTNPVVGLWHEVGTTTIWLVSARPAGMAAQPACSQSDETRYAVARAPNAPLMVDLLASRAVKDSARGAVEAPPANPLTLLTLDGRPPRSDQNKHQRALLFDAAGNDGTAYHAFGPIRLPAAASSPQPLPRLGGLEEVLRSAAWKQIAAAHGLDRMPALASGAGWKRGATAFLAKAVAPGGAATGTPEIGFVGRAQPLRRVAEGVECIGERLAPRPITYAGGGYSTPAGATLEDVWPHIVSGFQDVKNGFPKPEESEGKPKVDKLCTDPGGDVATACPSDNAAATASYLKCTITEVDKFGARELGGKVLTGSQTTLAPGVLIPSNSLDQQSFPEMQIKRPPWTISVVGCDGGDRISADADVSDFVHAHHAVSQLARDCVFRPKAEYVYASSDRTVDDLVFQLGFKGAYSGFKGTLDVNLTKKYEKNVFRVLIATSYLSANAARPPGDTYSAFADPKQTIEGPQVVSPHRFPVLLRGVTYGRLVYMNIVTSASSFSTDSKLTFSYSEDCADARTVCQGRRDDGNASCDLLPECITAKSEIEAGRCASQECKSCQSCRLQVADGFDRCMNAEESDHQKCVDALTASLELKLATLNSTNTDVLEAFVLGAGGTFSQDVLSGGTIEDRRAKLAALLARHPTSFSDLHPIGATGTYLDGSNDPAIYALPALTAQHDDCQKFDPTPPTAPQPAKYTLEVFDVDDEVQVWETTGSANGEPTHKLKEGYVTLGTVKEGEEKDFILKLSNYGCLNASGTFILWRHGENGKEEAWRGYEAPGVRHCNYTYRARLRLKRGAVELPTPVDACYWDWSCPK